MLIALIAVGLAPIAFADGPSGTGPGDPLMVTGNGQTLGPNASPWFYFDYTGTKSNIEVDLDANGIDNVGLAVFTPQQASAWQQDPMTKPIGIGSRSGAATAAVGSHSTRDPEVRATLDELLPFARTPIPP